MAADEEEFPEELPVSVAPIEEPWQPEFPDEIQHKPSPFRKPVRCIRGGRGNVGVTIWESYNRKTGVVQYNAQPFAQYFYKAKNTWYYKKTFYLAELEGVMEALEAAIKFMREKDAEIKRIKPDDQEPSPTF